MKDRSKTERRATSGARPFAPGEAPPGVRPGLGGQRRRAGADAGVRLLERSAREATSTTQRSERRRRIRPESMVVLRRVVVVLILAGALIAPPALAASGRLVVGKIAVVGTDLLDVDAIVGVAGVDLGENLLAVDLNSTERDLEALPFVARAQVRIGISGELRIEIRESAPMLRWRRGGDTYLISGSGRNLGRVDSPLLSEHGAQFAASLPLVEDASSVSFPAAGESVDPLDLDIVTRLASLTPEDLASSARNLTIRRDPQYGFVLRGVGDGVEWSAVFGIYSATIRPVEMIPAQVRLLRSLLASRERSVGWVILADGQAGTFTDPGVRPPPPPSPSVLPSPLLP